MYLTYGAHSIYMLDGWVDGWMDGFLEYCSMYKTDILP